MSKLPLIARILLGLIFFVFGLNGFLHFIPQPPMSGPAADFMSGMMATRYFLPLLSGTQTGCGLLLLIGRYVPLALTILAPVILNILAFHIFVAPPGLPIAFAVVGLEIYLAWVHRDSFRPLLRPRA